MAPSLLVEETASGTVARDVEVVDKPARLAAAASPLAWRILQELARAPDYPSALAARLKVHEQKVYYHVRRLEAARLIKVIRTEPKQGASAQVYAPTASAFALIVKGRGAAVPAPSFPPSGVVARFLQEFAKGNAFQGSVVVGSPYQHGPFLTTARDSPSAIQLGFYLGRLFGSSRGFIVRLDTEVKAAGSSEDHMILVGGPVANIVSLELNPHLAVNFDWKQVWRLSSAVTGRSYADEQVGLIAKVRNPWNREKIIILMGGLHHLGTTAAILGMTQFAEEVLDGYAAGEDFYRVVAGQDRDGDGRLDRVAILE